MSVRRRLLALASLSLLAFSSASFAQGGPPAMPVTVSEPLAKRVTQWDEYSGRFEAVASVEVRARVSGFIDKIDFRDGHIVKVGDPLFTIDKRPYEIAVESAEAEVARNKAQVDLAELQGLGRSPLKALQGAHGVALRLVRRADYPPVPCIGRPSVWRRTPSASRRTPVSCS